MVPSLNHNHIQFFHDSIKLRFTLLNSFNEISSDFPIWLDELRCIGTEGRLTDCPANTIGIEDCTHTQDVALVCTASKWIVWHCYSEYVLYSHERSSVYMYIILLWIIHCIAMYRLSFVLITVFRWRLEAGKQLRPNRRLLWQTRDLLQWTMGGSVWWQLQSKWCKGGLSSTRVLNLQSIRNSWNAIGSVYKLILIN